LANLTAPVWSTRCGRSPSARRHRRADAIAWALARGTDIVPLVGARRRDRLDEALGALPVTLTEADFAAIQAAVPADAAAGTRYDAFQMSILDSERK
jgi:diketogulonate reductase-like aldo/keto reductase